MTAPAARRRNPHAKGSSSALWANRISIVAKRRRTNQDGTARGLLAPNLARDSVREHTGKRLFHAITVDNGRFHLYDTKSMVLEENSCPIWYH
jgi:hypothetical protein